MQTLWTSSEAETSGAGEAAAAAETKEEPKDAAPAATEGEVKAE